ncbi:hypothetical protein [Neisseria sp. Ec49-e6-T10]|uniref:hypothetical protein n=1 Tax=Neisseria sp. Ec49-e6-T10 TaxID=3140744 RepID=UPI003EC1210E
MSKEFIFNKSLVEDEPTEMGKKHLNELSEYIQSHLDGLKALSFSMYRTDQDKIQCFAVDMIGFNEKYCSLTIGSTNISRWEPMYNTVDIDVIDGIDAIGILNFLISTFNLKNVMENKENGALVYY